MRPNNSCKGDNSKHGTKAFHFYLEVWYLDNNKHNIHVSSDKLGFFSLSFCYILVLLKVVPFSVTKIKTLSTQTVQSQPTQPKK